MSVVKVLWQNRRHFKLQIFGITVLLVLIAFLVNLLSIKIDYDNGVEEYMAATVKYTKTFQMSLSGATGTIDNIFIDNSKTQCFILATMNDTSKLTMDANKYQMFLTDATKDGKVDRKPSEQLVGEIYMFGTSGRIGLYFKSDRPFVNKMKKITLRSYKQYAEQTTPYYQTIPSDAQYDQCHIYFNPGGSAGETIDFLEKHVSGTDFNMSEIYRQISTVYQYEEVCKNLAQCENDMISLYGQMSEYRERLTSNYNLTVPESPSWIKGDKFEDVSVCDETGKVVKTYRKFVPNVIFAGGTNYDWQAGNVDEGYYHLVPDKGEMTLREYLLKLSSEKSYDVEKADFKTWTYTDGTEVVFSDKYVTNYELEMRNTIEAYKKLFDKYLDLKRKHQFDYLTKLLELEFETETMGQSYTVHRGNTALSVY